MTNSFVIQFDSLNFKPLFVSERTRVMAILKFAVTSLGETREEVVDTEKWPRTSSTFLMWLEQQLKINPLIYIPGTTGKFTNGNIEYEWKVLEVFGPLFRVHMEYQPSSSGPRRSSLKILSRIKRDGEILYCPMSETIYFNVPEEQVLKYLVEGTAMISAL